MVRRSLRAQVWLPPIRFRTGRVSSGLVDLVLLGASAPTVRRRRLDWLTIGGVAMDDSYGPGPDVAPVWRRSPWDGLVHAFRPENIGEVTAEALCEHSALASRLTEEDGRRCHACLLLHGDELADRQGDANRWGS